MFLVYESLKISRTFWYMCFWKICNSCKESFCWFIPTFVFGACYVVQCSSRLLNYSCFVKFDKFLIFAFFNLLLQFMTLAHLLLLTMVFFCLLFKFYREFVKDFLQAVQIWFEKFTDFAIQSL